MKIDVGCADIKLQGYVGIDAQSRNGVDYVCDVAEGILPLASESVEEVYTSHFLEHIYPIRIPHVLSEFYRVLQVGGKLRIIVPDTIKNILDLPKYEDDMPRYIHVSECVFGGSVKKGEGDLNYDSHKFIFTHKSLCWFTEQAGFKTEKIYSEELGRGGDSIFYEGIK